VSNPAVVNHTALIYGIDARGRIEVVYPANFAPADIVHDVRVLARS
jgi:cytochrome oxidase Cu insertion factor (SCO1/SenC/PrrC family)